MKFINICFSSSVKKILGPILKTLAEIFLSSNFDFSSSKSKLGKTPLKYFFNVTIY